MTALAFAASRRPVRVSATRSSRRARRAPAAAWEIRSFAAASAAIVSAFVLALAYLAGSTGVSSGGYEAQRLQGQRDELRRQNALLELEVAKLAAPARIETEARRLGLVRLSFIPVVDAVPLAARR
ncbi:MAG: hypothetical protein HYX56_02980 [Chloroflexi bacterium]|nr:hypothetical protein [Chloroflexota bacterium]